MALLPFLAGGAAIAGALSARSKNKKMPTYTPQPYSGYRPPRVEYLRPVESQITDIVMRRSKGEDVGFDPARRNQLNDIYNIEFERRAQREDDDINNRLSGMGLSRNVAATQALLGRARSDREADRSIYQKSIDVEDLTRRNEERDINTGRLQNLNTFNFGQENNAAAFDRAIWEAEQGNQATAAGIQRQNADAYEDPFASGVGSAVNTGLGVYALGQGGYSPYSQILSERGMGYRKDTNNQYLPQENFSLLQGLRRGKNFRA